MASELERLVERLQRQVAELLAENAALRAKLAEAQARIEELERAAARRGSPGGAVTRKLSCGNKTPRGKHCWEILASLAATAEQKSQDFVEHFARSLSLAPQAG